MKQSLPQKHFELRFRTACFRYLTLLITLFFFLSFQTSKAQTGEALNFDGVDDYVDISGVKISGSYTKEAWIYLPVVNPADPNAHNIISGSATSLYVYQGKLGAGHNFNNVQDPTVLTANTWYHVAVTFDASTGTMTLYKNGLPVNVGVAPAYTETTLLLGAIYTGTVGYFFQGNIDQVRIWNVVRTSSDIFNDFSCYATGNEPNLIALYPFTQGIAGGNNAGLTTLGDSSATPHNGTLMNFALNGTTSNWIAPGAPLTNACITLPVQLSNFSAEKSSNGVILRWETSTEINNKGFQIQRSTDGLNHWFDVAFIAGAGNTTERHKYSYNDVSPFKGNNYYRLKQINFDGESKYSNIKTVRIVKSGELSLYPTLAHDNITLEVANVDMLNTMVSVFDGQGRVVQKERLIDQKQQIDVSGLQRGMYLLRLENGDAGRFLKL